MRLKELRWESKALSLRTLVLGRETTGTAPSTSFSCLMSTHILDLLEIKPLLLLISLSALPNSYNVGSGFATKFRLAQNFSVLEEESSKIPASTLFSMMSLTILLSLSFIGLSFWKAVLPSWTSNSMRTPLYVPQLYLSFANASLYFSKIFLSSFWEVYLND